MANLRLICTSDTHRLHYRLKIPPGDVFIHTGDWSTWGEEEETGEFLEWIGNLPHKHKIVVPGNHDRWVEGNMAYAWSRFKSAGVRLLIDDSLEIEGRRFYGTPWTKNFCNWAFMAEEEQLEPIFAKIPKNTEILLCHGPPFGILDENLRGLKCGSKSFMNAISSLPKVKTVIFGHIHESAGDTLLNGVHYANVACFDRNFECAEFNFVGPLHL